MLLMAQASLLRHTKGGRSGPVPPVREARRIQRMQTPFSSMPTARTEEDPPEEPADSRGYLILAFGFLIGIAVLYGLFLLLLVLVARAS